MEPTIEELQDEIEALTRELDDTQSDLDYYQQEHSRLEDRIDELEDEIYGVESCEDAIRSLYIAKTCSSEREFDYQLRRVFLEILDKRL